MLENGRAAWPVPSWNYGGLVAVIAVTSVIFFAGLGRPPLWDEDETRFASVAREMLHSGDWVVPRYNGELADKPPLSFWMMAASFALFGENAAAARLPSAILSVCSVVALWWLAARLYGRTCAFWSALALATSLLFVAEARLATTDAALLALVTAGLALAAGGWWEAAGRMAKIGGGLRPFSAARAFLFGVVGGLGVLCKGPAALLLPFVTIWIFAWWMRLSIGGIRNARAFMADGARSLGGLRPLVVLAGVFLMVVPWHLALWLREGGDWFQIFYVRHYVGRLVWLQPLTGVALSVPEGHAGFPFFQIVALLAGLFPWSVFLPLAAWRTLRAAASRQGRDGHRPAEVFLSLWLLVWLLAVSLSSTQLPHYIFPAFPAACVMVGALVAGGLRDPSRLRTGWLYAAAGGLAAGGAIIAFGSVLASRILSLPDLAGLAWLGSIPVISAILFAVAAKADARKLAFGVCAAGAIVLQTAVFRFALPALAKNDCAAVVMAKAGEVSAGRPRMASYRYSAPSLVWAAGNPVRVCHSAGEVAAFLRSGSDAFAVIDAEAYGEVLKAAGCRPDTLVRFRPLHRRTEAMLLGPVVTKDSFRARSPSAP